MRECTIISKTLVAKRFLILFLLGCSFAQISFAQDPAGPSGGGGSSPQKKDDPGLFDQSSPYLEYGDFNMNEDENEDSLYFQYGRFFAMSLGLGYQTATGNRGKLYDAALPRFDIRLQYWFSFQFAMDLGIFFANHSFSDGTLTHSVKMIGYGTHLKYYFDVRDAAAPMSFANPYLEFGAGAMSKSETTAQSDVPESDSSFSVDLGGGFEFPIAYKKTYLNLEFLYHTQNFQDTTEDKYKTIVPNLNGGFVTLMAHLMFTW